MQVHLARSVRADVKNLTMKTRKPEPLPPRAGAMRSESQCFFCAHLRQSNDSESPDARQINSAKDIEEPAGDNQRSAYVLFPM